ncbi:MAG: succinate dehydrogenase, hydrophobic membrane anchor protein [Xanthomonadales bacterium]|nr:succinate dehydrogenase, hydrophobic membrane anchor protein [Xanthomonadales bacterium]
MRLVHPLATARGKGPAKSGVEHWWMQRLTAIALVPLMIWFVSAMAGLAGASHEDATIWLTDPLNAALMIAFIVAAFHHAQLGLQVVIEDYIHGPLWEYGLLISVKLLAILATIVAVLSILRVMFGG